MDNNYEILEVIERFGAKCQEGTSDKVYYITLSRVPQGFINLIYYGKRRDDVPHDDKAQSGLSFTTKPASPTTYDKAKKDFDEKFKEKFERKRYEPYQGGHQINRGSSVYALSSGDPETPPPAAELVTIELVPTSRRVTIDGTGFIPQLLNPVTLGACEDFFRDPDYWASPKADGDRFLLGHRSGPALASNRSGDGIFVPSEFEYSLAEFIEATGQTAGLLLRRREDRTPLLRLRPPRRRRRELEPASRHDRVPEDALLRPRRADAQTLHLLP